jgi:hypothetical protein
MNSHARHEILRIAAAMRSTCIVVWIKHGNGQNEAALDVVPASQQLALSSGFMPRSRISL